MKRFSTLLTGAVAALLIAGSVQAAPVPWKFNWTPSTTTVTADNALSGGDPSTSFLTLTDEPGRTVNTDHTDITTTNVITTSDAPPGLADQFINNGDVSFTLKLTDLTSNEAFSFLFTGTFKTQDLSDPSELTSESANVKFLATGTQTITKQLGTNEYTVNFVAYTPPGPPDSGNKGSIAYHVVVRNLDIQKAPEPSTMLLGGLGASFLSLGAWRKRRQAAAATV